MPETAYGIGTHFYGRAEPRPDDSYITTEWFVVFFIPIVPIRSLRLKPQGKGPGILTKEYEVLEVLEKVHPKQVGGIRKVSFVLLGLLFLFVVVVVVLFIVPRPS